MGLENVTVGNSVLVRFGDLFFVQKVQRVGSPQMENGKGNRD